MTLQMPRDILCPSYPAARVIEILTADHASNIVDRSTSTVRAWADPSRPKVTPNQEQERALDKACVEKSGEAPFADWYRRSRAFDERPTEKTFLQLLLKAGAAFGNLMNEAKDIEGVEQLSPARREQLFKAYQEFRKPTNDIETTILRLQRNGQEVD